MIAIRVLKYKILEWCIDSVISGLCKNFGKVALNGLSYLQVTEGMFFRTAVYGKPGAPTETVYNVHIISVKRVPDNIRKDAQIQLHVRSQRDPHGKHSDHYLKWSAIHWTFYP